MIKKSFTLAEMIIVISIIGIIAALTIPSLMEAYQKNLFATRAKKAYSELSQAYIMAQTKEGNPVDWDDSAFYGFDSGYIFAELNGKWFDLHEAPYSTWLSNVSMVNKRNIYCYIKNKCAFQDTNGEIFIQDWPTTNLMNDSSPFFRMRCSEYLVDVNGFEKPNIAGKDIFVFLIVSDVSSAGSNGGGPIANVWTNHTGVFPGGYYYNRCNDNNSITWSNFTCQLMLNNWSFSKNYPWNNITPSSWNGQSMN